MNLIVMAGLAIGILAILFGLAVFRLRQQPLSLERFQPRLEELLSDRVAPLQATVGGLAATRLRWSGIEITVSDIRLLSDDGHLWVSFAQVILQAPLSAVVSPRSLETFNGPWLFSDATVDALSPQPPFEALHGIAKDTDAGLLFDITGGRLGGVTIGSGRILISEDRGDNGHRGRRDAHHNNGSRRTTRRETCSHDGLDDIVGAAVSAASSTDEQGDGSRTHADISFHANGAAADALEILSREPFELIQPEALPAGPVQGEVEADIELAFVFDELPVMQHRTRAEVGGLRLPNAVDGLDLTEGIFDINVADDTATVEGTAHLGGVPMTLHYSMPAGPQPKTLTIKTADVGSLAASMDISGRLSGGLLGLRLTRSCDEIPWSGSVDIQQIQVLQAPLLSRLLTMASLTGLVSTLISDGLKIDNAHAEITIESGRIRCTSIRISVDQLEITGEVDFHLNSNRIQGDGLLVPAAALQRLVGAVPVLGAFLEGFGKKNAPIVATRFTLSGPLSYPEITVHPLSSIAPDILRDLGLV